MLPLTARAHSAHDEGVPTQRRYGPEFPPERHLRVQLERANAKLDKVRELRDDYRGSGFDEHWLDKLDAILEMPS